MLQLDFLDAEKSKLQLLEEKIEKIGSGSSNIRKSLFARHSELDKKYRDLLERLDIIERNICKGSYGISENKQSMETSGLLF